MMDMSAMGSGPMDMSAVGCGALEASFRAKPVANRRADAPPRLKAYICGVPWLWRLLNTAMRQKSTKKTRPNHTKHSVGFGGVYTQ